MSGLIQMDRLSTTAGADVRSAACSSSGSGYLPSDIPSATPASNVVEAKGGWRGCRTGPRPRNAGSIIFVDPIVKINARSENAPLLTVAVGLPVGIPASVWIGLRARRRSG